MTDASLASAQSLKDAADRAAQGGDLRRARDLLSQAVAIGPGDPGLWMSLAACNRALGDLAGAMTAVEAALKLEPRLFVALLLRASLLERAGEARAAAVAYGIALTQTPRAETLNEPTRKALEHGQRLHARYLDELQAALADEAKETRGLCSASEARRVDMFRDQIAGKRKIYQQEPVTFHYPGLPAIEFYDREEFDWLEGLESHTAAMREEFLAAMAEDGDLTVPYIDYPDGVPLDQWAELNRSPRWSALHLHRDGQPVAENARRCPRTMQALATAPQPQVLNRSPASMFSVLQPRTHIPPHTGVANTRLVAHLPLIVPEGCGFRVGGETRAWREGEAWVFDDTINHEAWNDSDRPRTILIFDVWSPRISPAERAAIATLMAAIDRFNGAPSGQGEL
ncbi:MAG: aspartyl/asparaginyl beta-hydroxylase domain-containing protein [Caulobacterales bacterium]